MAEYGIVMSVKDIPGNCVLPDFKDAILCESATFESHCHRLGKWTATPDKDRRISVSQSSVALTILAGKWVALLENALFNKQVVGDVVITQLGQAVDKQTTAKPSVIQKVTLANATVTAVQQTWTFVPAPRHVNVSLEFSHILFEIGDKKADFTLRNFTQDAV